MDTFHIYLKGGSVLEVRAQRIDFPDAESKLLQIHLSDTKTDKDKIILTSEVAAVVRQQKASGALAMGKASPRRES